MKFEESTIEDFSGRGKSKWDHLLPKFNAPGKTLHFTEGVTPIQASQCARRLNVLDPENKYHSGMDAIKGCPYVRRRMPNEVPNEEEKDESEEESKVEKKSSILDRL